MIFPIYRIKNQDECYDAKTGDSIPYLTYETPFPPDEVISTGAADATLEELVDLCDHDAENINAHEFCGTHRLMGAVLYHKVGRTAATGIMLDIASRGGLHRMSGVCTRTDSYAELGVGQNGHEWSGQYG